MFFNNVYLGHKTSLVPYIKDIPQKKAVSKFRFIAEVGMLKGVTKIIEILILITY